MRIAIIGKSPINEPLKERLLSEGLTPVLVENINDILGVVGQKGDFAIRTRYGDVEAGYVIATQGPELSNPVPEVPSLPLSGSSVQNILDKNAKQAVLLLDYPDESPGIMTEIALKKAAELARKRVNVVCLARFIRTSGGYLEQLYREARHFNAVFIKYSELSMDCFENAVVIHARINEGNETISIKTDNLIIAEKISAGEDIREMASRLRIHLDDEGKASGDNPFVFSAMTNRKGVFALHNTSPGLTNETKEMIDYTIAAIKMEMAAGKNSGHAVVDADKCALCYTCYRVCTHAAMAPDPNPDRSAMMNLEEACYGCGICVSQCPAAAVRLTEAGMEVKPEMAMKGSLKIFCCENSAKLAFERAKPELEEIYDKVDITPVSCGGEITTAGILSALHRYRKVLVAVCMDDACKHLEGNKRAKRQVLKAQQLLKSIAMDPGRIEYVQLSHAMPRVMAETVIEALG